MDFVEKVDTTIKSLRTNIQSLNGAMSKIDTENKSVAVFTTRFNSYTYTVLLNLQIMLNSLTKIASRLPIDDEVTKIKTSIKRLIQDVVSHSKLTKPPKQKQSTALSQQ